MTKDIRDIPDSEVEDTALVVEALQGRLDPEKVALVRRRLDEDEKFREDMAPLILAWNTPTIEDDKPLPPGELEKNWDKFTKAAGFVHQKAKARKRWRIVFGVFLFLGAIAVAVITTRRAPISKEVTFPVVASNGVVSIGRNVTMQLSPGASIRRTTVDGADSTRVLLDGAAHVTVTNPALPATAVIETVAGRITAMNADVRITARRNMTIIGVQRGDSVIVRPHPGGAVVVLHAGDSAALIEGKTPQVTREAKR